MAARWPPLAVGVNMARLKLARRPDGANMPGPMSRRGGGGWLVSVKSAENQIVSTGFALDFFFVRFGHHIRGIRGIGGFRI